MNIVYDTTPPPLSRGRASSAPTASLLHRIQKAPLLERLSRDDSSHAVPSAPRSIGPIRTKDKGVRGGVKGRGGAARGASKKPKTAQELDSELDAFMGDGETSVIPVSAPDVAMA
jgi:THO complex subunit 4